MGLEVAGWFASAAISGLSALVSSYIREQYKYQTGAKRKLKSMEQSLGRIKPVIDVVERRGVEEETGLLSWLNDLKDAAYDAEDILDLFEYQSLRDKVESRNWVKSLKTACKRLTFSDDSLNQLCDVVNKFDDLAKDGRIDTFLKVVELCTDTNREDKLLEDRETTPICVEPTVFGRTKQVEELLNYLLVSFDASGSNSDNFSVVSIVGVGGVGKTTLAQSVFNDPRVTKHFDPMAWVCVSNSFDIKRVMREIMESASKQSRQDIHNRTNLGRIQRELIETLQGQRFLIVLDDVWDDTASHWDNLYSAFRYGKEGSRVVVTTRQDNVAEAMRSKRKIKLEGLETKEYMEFFRCCAFGDVNPKDHPKLGKIGDEIAKKLGRLPLAAKVVGGMLKCRLEDKYWRGVLENKLWQKEDGITASLKLSYNYLPPHLKQCFVYCALFPKDYEFDKGRLVHIWVALGYIRPGDGNKKTLEGVGQRYFDELVSRSFFQERREHIPCYVIHDLLHDLAESISGHEVYRQEEDNLMELNIDPKRIRHLFVRSTNLNGILDQIQDTERLRSLVHDPRRGTNKISEAVLETTFKKLPGLRVLIVGTYYESSQLADTIDRMVHLRYLELPRGTTLPVSLCKLYHLQVLVHSEHKPLLEGPQYPHNPEMPFRSCDRESRANPEIPFRSCDRESRAMAKLVIKLINLRYLYTIMHWGGSAIPGVGQLTSLQRLDCYEVGVDEGHRISELGRLRQIRGSLCIGGLDNVANKEEASKAELHNKEHLDELELHWDHNHNHNHNHGAHEEVLEGLRPHSNLKSLKMWAYMGNKPPGWFNTTCLSNVEDITLSKCQRLTTLPPLGEFPFLKYLRLCDLESLEKIELENTASAPLKYLRHMEICRCPNLKVVPPLGELSSLEVLDLEGLDSLEQVGTEIYDMQSIVYPSLEELSLSDVKAPREWSPCHRRLNIARCPKFQGPKSFRSTPERLNVDFGWHVDVDGISALTRYIPEKRLGSLQILAIRNMWGVEAFTVEQQEWFKSLTSLGMLGFSGCRDLLSLPNVMGSLASLVQLVIRECPGMLSLGDGSLPTRLEELIIDAAPELQKRCDWRRDGSEWDKISHVPHILIEGEYIRRPPPALLLEPPRKKGSVRVRVRL